MYLISKSWLVATAVIRCAHGATLPTSNDKIYVGVMDATLSNIITPKLRRPLQQRIASSAATSHNDSRQLQQQSGQVDKIRLINADTDLPILDLTDGMVINIAEQSTAKYNIQATVAGGTVGAIVFGFQANRNFRTEKDPPYAFCGDRTPVGNYLTCTELVVGSLTVSATPVTDGIAGTTKSVSFRIVNVPPTTCNVPRFTDADWTSFTPDYPIDTSEPMGLIIGNDYVSFGGFINSFSATTNRTYARDITIPNSPWRRMNDMALAISLTHASLVRVGTKVYMCGGYLGAHPGPHTALCFVYDHSIPPSRRQWTRIQSLPNGGYSGGGMVYDTVRNALYFSGGGQRLNAGSIHPIDSNRAYKYSLNNTSAGWVAITPMPYAANHISSVTQTYNGVERHYFLGGQVGEFEAQQNLPNVYEFDASTESWIRRTFMPSGRGHATASTHPIGCGFIVAGGSVNSPTSRKLRTNTILYYNIPSDSWTTIGTLPVAIPTPLVDIHSNGYMYYINSRDTARRRISV